MTPPPPWKPLPSDDPTPGALVRRSLEHLVSKLGMSTLDEWSVIHKQWPEIVGATIAEHSRPVTLRDGTLKVVVDDSQWLTQLKWVGPKIVDRLNKATSTKAVERLEVRLE